ncbi:MAG: hypothetical protein WBP81_10660 [Solirubrobacteraceae bacterium]
MDRFIANEVFSELLRLDPTHPQSLVFHDPEGHEVELMVSDSQDTPLVVASLATARLRPRPRNAAARSPWKALIAGCGRSR